MHWLGTILFFVKIEMCLCASSLQIWKASVSILRSHSTCQTYVSARLIWPLLHPLIHYWFGSTLPWCWAQYQQLSAECQHVFTHDTFALFFNTFPIQRHWFPICPSTSVSSFNKCVSLATPKPLTCFGLRLHKCYVVFNASWGHQFFLI